MINDIHIGEQIRKIVYERGLTAVSFGKRIHHSREAVRGIFSRPGINTALLVKISRVLDYDFFRHYSVDDKDNEVVM